MASVSFQSASCRYPGAERPAVDALDLDVADGEFLVLVGPSGCGKSTSLRMLAGLEETTGGAVRIGDRDITGAEPKERDIAMVFQNYALYPHLSVADNMAFALTIARTPRAEISRRVTEAARMLDLTDYLDRRPKALSGGQRQRVAMGRAIVRQPQVFCMDEPLSNLDAKLRTSTRAQIAALQRRLGTTTVYVTHDQHEAMTMGHRIAVLRDGVLQQVATPAQMYRRPVNTFVAGFIGSPAMNLFDMTAGSGLGGHVVPLPHDVAGPLTIGLRPEDLRLAPEGIAVDVDLVEEFGSDAYLHGRIAGASEGGAVVARVGGRTPPAVGDRVHLAVDPADVHLFSATTGERIG